MVGPDMHPVLYMSPRWSQRHVAQQHLATPVLLLASPTCVNGARFPENPDLACHASGCPALPSQAAMHQDALAVVKKGVKYDGKIASRYREHAMYRMHPTAMPMSEEDEELQRLKTKANYRQLHEDGAEAVPLVRQGEPQLPEGDTGTSSQNKVRGAAGGDGGNGGKMGDEDGDDDDDDDDDDGDDDDDDDGDVLEGAGLITDARAVNASLLGFTQRSGPLVHPATPSTFHPSAALHFGWHSKSKSSAALGPGAAPTSPTAHDLGQQRASSDGDLRQNSQQGTGGLFGGSFGSNYGSFWHSPKTSPRPSL